MQKINKRPNPIHNPRLHRRSDTTGGMNAAKVVVREVQRRLLSGVRASC